MKKRILALLMVMIMITAITGCGNSTSEDTSATTKTEGSEDTKGTTEDKSEDKEGSKDDKGSGEAVTVRITFGPNEFTDDQIAEFEAANPDIVIERVEVDDAKLMAMIAAGTAPDVVKVVGVQQLPTYISRGLAMNIQHYIDDSELINTEDLLPIANVYRYENGKTGSGELYGLPKDWSLDQALFINKQIFQDAGVEIPDPTQPLTFSELNEIAKKLTKLDADGNIEIAGITGADNLFTLPNIQYRLQQKDLTLYSDDYTSVDINNEAVKAIFEDINDLVQAKATYSALSPNPSGNPWPAFLEGKVGIIQSGYWFSGFLRMSDLTKDNLDNFMMLPAPIEDGGKRYSPCTSATGCIILNQSQNPDEAFRFFEYFIAGPPADGRAQSGWGLPIFKSKFDMIPQETEFDKQTYAVTFEEIENANSGEVLAFDPYLNSAAFAGLLDKLITPLYFGSDDKDKAFEKLQEQVNILIQEGMDIAGIQ